MRKLFGTDGVRGIANTYPITSEVALKIGQSAAYIFKNKVGRHRIVIGKDTRLSGYMLETALASGICSMGVDVLLVGPMPTPGVAFITQDMRADAGIVISASHNPYQDNGIKIFSHNGFKLPDEQEEEIERLVLSEDLSGFRPDAGKIGKAHWIDDALGRYVVYLKFTFPVDLSLEGIRIVVDCANGATYRAAPLVFRELGADVIELGTDPDGENINRGCGAVYPDMMREAVRKHRADIGLALDGDGDRSIFADENGEIVDGDHVMAICAIDMKKRGVLKKNHVVATVLSNVGLELALKKEGINLVRTGVGDRYVVEKMRECGCNFGGEKSGHLIFLDYSTTGDGILAALQLMAVMIRTGKKMSELAKIMEPFPQVQKSVYITKREDFDNHPVLGPMIEKMKKKLGTHGRIVVRYSGTEPKVRIMVEGSNENIIKQMGEELATEIGKILGPSPGEEET